MLAQSVQNFAGAAIRLAVSVATIPLLLRFLGIAQCGLWLWVQAVVGVFSAVEVALATTATIHLARRDDRARAGTLTATLFAVLAIGLALSATLWLLAGPISLRAGELAPSSQIELMRALEVSAGVVLARLLQQPFAAMQHAMHRFGTWNVLQTAQTSATSVGIVVLAMRGGDLVALSSWQALTAFCFLGGHGFVGGRLWDLRRWRPAWSPMRWRIMGSDASMAFLGTLGSVLFAHADRLVVAPQLGATQLGIYGSLGAMASQINTLSANAAQPLLPRVSEKANQTNDIAGMVAAPFRLSVLLALGLSLGLMAFGPWAMRWTVPAWGEVGDDTALRWMSLIYGLYSLNAAGYYILHGLRRLGLTALVVLISGTASLGAIAFGAHVYGLRGAVLGNTCYIATFVLVVLAMKQIAIPTRRWLGWLAPPLALFAFAALVVMWSAA